MIDAEKLNAPLPTWALKEHPTKRNMTVIHPMAVIDRLNEVFGVGKWKFKTEHISHEAFIQKTQRGDRDMFRSAVKGTLIVPEHNIHIEQYGGSSNDDLGDALKGGATDALTKCASYLGVGASIYKGQGNVEPPKTWTLEEALKHVSQSTTVDELNAKYKELPVTMQKDDEVIAKCKELKEELTK